ncbi:nucleotidyltransferase family protein [Sphingomonas sp.]|uniref:nucleotidyltransferase domain-containing protein n=1 Tax=Sphingomonas sp. TaxID=28214 RepID=UPI0025F81901|nr:nucleotidyltransferase family protein [Sphingomonas sp.]
MKSVEFLLTVECCRAAFDGGKSRKLAELTAAVDRDRFVRVARYHRVQGLAWNGLQSSGADVPGEIAASLSADTKVIAASNLKALAEAGAMLAQFERAGIPLLFVKGLTLGALAYPNPMLKMGWDIDILIGEGDLLRAAGELEARGYRRMIPAPSADLKNWHQRSKESVWARPEERLYVELHTRLADNVELISGIGVDSPRQLVGAASGAALPTLAGDELFAYLCVHGASSLWFRLKWITDLAALLHHLPPGEIEALYDRSQLLGAGRASAQALLHADDLYGTLAGTDLRQRLQGDRASSWLAAAAMKQVAGRDEPREPVTLPLGTAWIHLSQLLLRPGIRFKLGELMRQLRGMALG